MNRIIIGVTITAILFFACEKKDKNVLEIVPIIEVEEKPLTEEENIIRLLYLWEEEEKVFRTKPLEIIFPGYSLYTHGT